MVQRAGSAKSRPWRASWRSEPGPQLSTLERNARPSTKPPAARHCQVVNAGGWFDVDTTASWSWPDFDYDKNLRETFPFDQSKQRLGMYLLKKHVLPKLYWHGMLEGRF